MMEKLEHALFTLLDFPSGSCHDQNPQSSSVFSFSSFPGVRMKIEGCVSTPAEAVAFWSWSPFSSNFAVLLFTLCDLDRDHLNTAN